MGRPSGKKLVREASKEDLAGSGPEPEKINLDDQLAIKSKLDCTVADVSARGAARTSPQRAGARARRAARAARCSGQLHWPGDAARRGAPPASTAGAARPSPDRPVCLQVVLNCGYEEDYLISNVKLALGFLA
jgi:hypothetical protein